MMQTKIQNCATEDVRIEEREVWIEGSFSERGLKGTVGRRDPGEKCERNFSSESPKSVSFRNKYVVEVMSKLVYKSSFLIKVFLFFHFFKKIFEHIVF